MKHRFIFLSISLTILLTSLSCSNRTPDNNPNLPNIPVNVTISLNSPSYINLQVPGGWAYSDNGGIRGLIIYNLNGNDFVAFDRACPHLSPTQNCSQMTVDSGIKMICPCDQAEFNILNGAPLTAGINVSAREYRATLIGSNTLSITNF
jgi:nitrite reductase/ring-hydroxylating ferredoxin subunit